MSPKITAIILAGGEGSRFQAKDKGLIDWQNKALIDHVISRIEPQVDHCMISCNRNIERYQQRNLVCVSDNIGTYQGPLAGIQAGLSICETDYALIVSCDCPQLPSDLVNRLFGTMTEQKADICYANDGQRRQYLASIMKRKLLPSLNAYLESSKRSVRGWYEGLNTVSCDFSDNRSAFFNVNNEASLLELDAFTANKASRNH